MKCMFYQMKKNNLTKQFINEGFLNIKNDQEFVKKCQNLYKDIKKKVVINSKIFLTYKSYLKNKTHKKTGDVLADLDISFILNNKNINFYLETVLGKNYQLADRRVICGIPKKYIPNYITKKEDIRNINLGHFIKRKYRTVRYFNGIDFHQDQMDYSSTKCKVVTLYVYLDEVTKNKSPLIILPKSHKLGPDLFPHQLVKQKNKISYTTRTKKKLLTTEKKLIGKPGESWVWHSCLLHGTRSNISTSGRISLRLKYKKNERSKNTAIDKVNKCFGDKKGYKLTNEYNTKNYNDVLKKLQYSTKI